MACEIQYHGSALSNGTLSLSTDWGGIIMDSTIHVYMYNSTTCGCWNLQNNIPTTWVVIVPYMLGIEKELLVLFVRGAGGHGHDESSCQGLL